MLENPVFSDNTYFMDVSKVLNNSKAGAEVQEKLKKRFDEELKKFQNDEEKIKKEESEIISQRKILSNEDYEKKVNDLRKKVADLQRNKDTSLNSIAKNRNDARDALIKSVNPIIKKYMEDNKIRLIVNNQSVVLGDVTLDITDKIIELLNKELPSIKIN